MARRAGLVTAAMVVLALGRLRQANPGQHDRTPPNRPRRPAPAAPALTDAQKKALLAELPAAYQAADLSNGEAKFAVCAGLPHECPGRRRHDRPEPLGRLRPQGGLEGSFTYSDDMKAAGWTWDADHLDKWITNPKRCCRHQDDLRRRAGRQRPARHHRLPEGLHLAAAEELTGQPPMRRTVIWVCAVTAVLTLAATAAGLWLVHTAH